MEQGEVSLGWNDDGVPLHTHACYYYSDEETLRNSLGFVRTGLNRPDDLGVIFCDESRFDQLSGWLQGGYPGSVEALIASGKLALIGGAPTMDELVTKIGRRHPIVWLGPNKVEDNPFYASAVVAAKA